MIFLLLLIIIIITCTAFLLFQKDILAPSAMTCAVVGFSVFIAMLNVSMWGSHLYVCTMIVIVGGLICFIFGEATIEYFAQDTNDIWVKKKSIIETQEVCFVYSWIFWAFGILISLLLVYVYKDTLSVAQQLGYTADTGNMLGFARIAFTTQQATITKVTAQAYHIARGALLVTIGVGIYNVSMCKCHLLTQWPLLLICIPAFGIEVLTTNRTGFIEIIAYIVMLTALFWRYQVGNSWSYTIKILLLSASALVIFFLLFLLLGAMGGRGSLSKAFDSISLYTGFSLPSLDAFIRIEHMDNPYFGYESFSGIYNILFKLRLAPSESVAGYLPFYHIGTTSGNIYTAFRKPLSDFGYIGMFFSMFMTGFFYSSLNVFIKKSRKITLLYFIYAYLSYYLLMQGVESVLLPGVLSTTTIYRIIYCAIFWSILFLLPAKLVKSKKRLLIVEP